MNIIEHNKNGLVYLASDGFEAAGGVVHGFSTRLGGVSEGIFSSLNLGMNRGDDPDRVAENYRRFCAAIGADVKGVVCASQVHGDTVRSVTTADLGIGLDQPEPWQADGLVTDIPGVVLTVLPPTACPSCSMTRCAGWWARSTPAGGAPPWASPPVRWSGWWIATAATGWTFWPPSVPASPSAVLRPTRMCPTP